MRGRLRMSKKSCNFARNFCVAKIFLTTKIKKQTKNINKHANNQTETWIGHSV